ncbi:MAG: hypothetical protein RJA07_1371 [Bacteroidota bacterium]|jgi:hypothetical protein
MKNIGLIAVILFVFWAFNSNAQINDLQGYSLKGKVKRIISLKYDNVLFFNGEWQPYDSTDLAGATSEHFNLAGNIDTTLTELVDSSGYSNQFLLVNEYIENRKIASKYFNQRKKLIEKDSYKWVDDSTYEITTLDSTGKMIMITKSWYHKDGKEYKTEYKRFKKNEIFTQEKYICFYDSKGHLRQANYDDEKLKTKYTILYSLIDMDEKENCVKAILLNATDCTVKELVIRKIEYY